MKHFRTLIFELLISGLQEYVEALSFYHHLKYGEMISWDQGMVIIFQYLYVQLISSTFSYHFKVLIQLTFFILVQSRLSFQVLPTLPEDATSGDLEAVDELSKELGVEEKMKNVPLPSDDSSNNSEDRVKVLVPQADYMLGIAGKNNLSHFIATSFKI